MRTGEVKRETKETKITAKVNLDGTGEWSIDTGIPFFDHMLSQVAKQGLFDITIAAKGDLQIEDHHTVEDTGLALGEAFAKALGDKAGIRRYGFFMAPLDEALGQVVIDLSGRPWCTFEAQFKRDMLGTMSTENVREFFIAFASASKSDVQVRSLAGENDHHKMEAIFKSFGMALRMACEKDERRRGIPSTKGTLGGKG